MLQENWEKRLLWNIRVAEIALAKYEWLLGDAGRERLNDLIIAGNNAIEREDATNGATVEQAIDEVLEKRFGPLVLLLQAEMRCRHRTLEPEVQAEIEQLVVQIATIVQLDGNPAEFAMASARLVALMHETKRS